MLSVDGVSVVGPATHGDEGLFTPQALRFLGELERRFGRRRDALISARVLRQRDLAASGRLDFLAATREIREDEEWRIPSAPSDLMRRQVEITGPTDAKMVVNALNSGADVFMADFEDANTPTWQNMVRGQLNVFNAIRRQLDFVSTDGRAYRLSDRVATLMVRPRGWHLSERHVLVDDRPMSASLFDFGLFFFHNARELCARGSGPYLYLPKLEHHLEARLWNEAFAFAEELLEMSVGTIRATVLIETIMAAFQMEEILYELRSHASGLNAGRWDYMFSIIKAFRDLGTRFVLPDRNSVTMTAPFMRAYTELLVSTCHRRGAFAIGGMAAFVPSRHHFEVNKRALAKVREDKEREAGDGFDGSWVAHPDLVPVCREVFERFLGDSPNQLDRLRGDVRVSGDQIIDVAATPGEITGAGLRNNVAVGLRYLASWISGTGAVAIFNLMEDAATAEIARSQVWQWVRNGVTLAGANRHSGARVTSALVLEVIKEELEVIRGEIGDEAFAMGGYERAGALFEEVAVADEFSEFFTLVAYEMLD